MSKAGSRILEGAREALAVANGEAPAASITVNGHRYVPADRLASLEKEVEELRNQLKTSEQLRVFWNDKAIELSRSRKPSEAEGREG